MRVMNFTIHLILFLLSLTLCTSVSAKVIYVDDDATGVNNGTSWENAYIFLQEALADAESSEKPVEIRVGQGIYMPNQGLVAIPEFDWRTTTFQLINDVSLQGGYAGIGGEDPNQRDIQLYETILSGDLNGDDDPNFANNSENSYHIVTGSGTDNTAVLDGFVITGGNADGDWLTAPSGRGGGMYNKQSSPTLTNCTFSNDSAYYGGGMYNENSNPQLTDCSFENNSAETYYEPGPGAAPAWGGSGGAMCNENSSPVLDHCIFSENTQMAMHNSNSSPTLSYCIFIGNSSWNGGAIYSWNSKPILANCIFNNNRSFAKGGAFAIKGHSDATLLNCIFVGNMAGNNGGAVHSYGSNATLINCTLAENEAHKGKALECSTVPGDGPSTLQLANCIIWNDGDEIWNNDDSTIVITFSNIHGGFPGEGNISDDPLFANLGYWVDANDPNIVIEPNDLEAVWKAVWIDGDYHLMSQTGRWDPNSESWVVDDVTSPSIDAGDPNSDFSGETWPHGGRINMGAYGGTREASMSTETGGMTLPNVAYIYHDEVESTEDYQALLNSYGCSTTLIPSNEVATAGFDTYDLIIAGADTGYMTTWTNEQNIAAVESSGKPIFGLGNGGYWYFGQLGLSIGRPNGGHGSENSIEVIDPNSSIFSTPYSIEIPEDRALQLYTETDSIGIYLWPDLPETVTGFGRNSSDPGYYFSVAEHDKYMFWGFTESPQKMTEAGKKLFINVVILTANNAWESYN